MSSGSQLISKIPAISAATTRHSSKESATPCWRVPPSRQKRSSTPRSKWTPSSTSRCRRPSRPPTTKGDDMYNLLGRQTSGNVQKVIFMFEELGTPYTREDYGRQFENTQTAEYKALNPTSKVPTLVDGSTVIWESNTILRYLAASIGRHLHGATPAEKTDVERWMDFLLAAVNPGYLAAFKNAKLKPEEQTAESKELVKDLVAQLKIVDGHLAGRDFLALGKF